MEIAVKYEVRDAQGNLIRTVTYAEKDAKHGYHEVNLLRLTQPENTFTIL